MVSFNWPPCYGTEMRYIEQVIASHQLCGDGPFSKKCQKWMQDRFDIQKAFLTTSCTSALDMALLLCKLQPGDEVILPSFTFSSTATLRRYFDRSYATSEPTIPEPIIMISYMMVYLFPNQSTLL